MLGDLKTLQRLWLGELISILKTPSENKEIKCTLENDNFMALFGNCYFSYQILKKTYFHHVQKFKINNKNVGRRTSQSMFRESLFCFLFYRSPV